MAVTKAALCLAVLCLIFVQELHVDAQGLPANNAPKIDCAAKCQFRCSKAKKDIHCLKTCNSCCNQCNCVPPGTVGNREVCPCYANLKNNKGKTKCP